MHTIIAENVNDALAKGLNFLLTEGKSEDSRNGKVIVAPCPVITIYNNPTQRVLFSQLRDANPFFHLMESLWMLAGRNDLAFPALFNKRFTEYSDDSKTVHGAYGFRWREHFGYDQLEVIAKELKANPATRRCVLAMWDPTPQGETVFFKSEHAKIENYGANDLNLAVRGGKDVPCNTHAYFDVMDGKLNMTVLCRSNDVIWGAYGANAVHFSILQEYMAAWVGVPVGLYRQFSNNYHAYTDVYSVEKLTAISKDALCTNFYGMCNVKLTPLISTGVEVWNEDLNKFMSQRNDGCMFNDPFFNSVAIPMYNAYMERKNKTGSGMRHVENIIALDWRLACIQWIQRREEGK